MKLSTNDLDKSLIDKITQLDEMRLNYTKDDGNIVMYDGNSFYTGKMPEVKVKLPYFSTEELYNFKQNLFSNNELYTSSYTNNFQNEVRNNSAFKNIMKSMSYSFISKLDSTALFFKMYGSYYYAFTSSGKLYKISKTQLNEQTVFDIIAILKTNFACQNLFARKILDIIPYEDGFLISVLDNGVYYININTGIYELKLNITSINKLYRLNSTKILALSNTEKKSVIIFDAVSGKKIDSFDTLSNFNQLPDSAVITEKGFYVLGKYIGNSAPINMIHYWQLDAGEISYENYDDLVDIALEYNKYQYITIDNDENNLLVYGIKSNGNIFRCVYDIQNNTNDYYEMDVIKPNSTKLFVNKNIYIVNNSVYIIEDNAILDMFKLSLNINDKIYFDKNSIIYVGGRDIISYTFPKYAFYPTESFVIYDENGICNNIKILVSSTTGKEKIALFNGETKEQIIPQFYGLTENNEFIIVLKNCKATKIVMTIDFNKESEIKNIVVKTNREYFEE